MCAPYKNEGVAFADENEKPGIDYNVLLVRGAHKNIFNSVVYAV